MEFIIKTTREEDLSNLQTIFIDTVLNVNRKDYSQAEVEDWASCGKNIERFFQIFNQHQFFHCELNSEVVGFTSLNNKGFIHSFFISSKHQRIGIGRILMKTIIEKAYSAEHKTLTAEVSITAKPFFERFGFKALKKQQAKANTLYLTNFVMVKELS